MDVHYLPSNRHFKSVKEYIVDLFIIFLAVILGFMGNDLRESYLAKAKAKEYARLLSDDLRVDLSNLQRTYNDKKWIEEKYDSAEDIVATKDIRQYNEFIYYVERYLSNNTVFTSQDMTFQQLRSTGNFRYIKNPTLSKKIADYYNLYNQYRAVETTYGSSYRNDLNGIESKLFNPRDLTSLDNTNALEFRLLVKRPTTELKPIRRETDYLKFFYIKLDNAKKYTNRTKQLLEKQRVYGSTLLKDLKAEYQLK